jgi:hypothetical protein
MDELELDLDPLSESMGQLQGEVQAERRDWAIDPSFFSAGAVDEVQEEVRTPEVEEPEIKIKQEVIPSPMSSRHTSRQASAAASLALEAQDDNMAVDSDASAESDDEEEAPKPTFTKTTKKQQQKLAKTSVAAFATTTLHATSTRSTLAPVPEWTDKPDPETYGKLNSKEKRQMRNKISARNFRHRRKGECSNVAVL